jgi:hypothetical protein
VADEVSVSEVDGLSVNELETNADEEDDPVDVDVALDEELLVAEPDSVPSTDGEQNIVIDHTSERDDIADTAAEADAEADDVATTEVDTLAEAETDFVELTV